MRSFADVVRLRAPARREVDLGEIVDERCSVDTSPGRVPERRCPHRARAGSGTRLRRSRPDRAGPPQHREERHRGHRPRWHADVPSVHARRPSRAGNRGHRPGIAPSVRDQLFMPFFSTKEGGQGIGLTLVQEILVNHDSRLRARRPTWRADAVHDRVWNVVGVIGGQGLLATEARDRGPTSALRRDGDRTRVRCC